MIPNLEIPIAGGLNVALPKMALVRQRFDDSRLDIHAEHFGNARCPQENLSAGGQVFGFYRVYEWPGLTTCNINEQTSCPLNGARLTLKVDAPLKAMTGIGVQTVLPRSARDGFWRKEKTREG